jgi:hypothetical protein
VADRTRLDYLRELYTVLPFPDDRRAEIVEEIEAHLDDAVDDGLSEATAQRRLGEPMDLARDLARPEQSAWRVLVGAGVAVRSGIGHWLYGYFVGSLIVLLFSLTAALLVQAIGSWLGTGWSLATSDQGWNTMLIALAAALGLYYAGRVMPDRLARASRRLMRDVRPWAVSATTVLAASITILIVDAAQNWASVVALALAPGAVALGAYRPRLMPSDLRAYAAIVVLAMALPVAILAASGVGTSAGAVDVDHGPQDRNLPHIGPAWPAIIDPHEYPFIESGGWSRTADGRIAWDATIAPGALRGVGDLRLEAWHTHDAGFAIDTSHDAPFATAVPKRHGATLEAVIDTERVPGVGGWDLVLTGVGPDGVRYVLAAGSGGHSTFTGSVWDWVTAVIDD